MKGEEYMSKVKVHPTDPTMYMFWDVATNEPNAFYIRDCQPSWVWNENFEKPTVSPLCIIDPFQWI